MVVSALLLVTSPGTRSLFIILFVYMAQISPSIASVGFDFFMFLLSSRR